MTCDLGIKTSSNSGRAGRDVSAVRGWDYSRAEPFVIHIQISIPKSNGHRGRCLKNWGSS